MKRVIDRKLYDTETAEELHSWENGYTVNNFHYCVESLYMTERGAFFLVGEGGPATEYKRQVGDNSWTGGERITPLTRDEALRWLETHDGSAVIMRHFPDAVEEA